MAKPMAELVIQGVPVYGAPGAPTGADAVAIADGEIVGVGKAREIRRLITPETRIFAPGRGCVIPGLIDGHAHMDREGLKSSLPSLDGAGTKEQILERIAAEAASRQPGEWLVTMPVGTAPDYEQTDIFDQKGYPDRWDLDAVAPDNPVYIRPIWGYWRKRLPLVSIANSRALRLAGIDRATLPPCDDVTIVRDPASGEPNGIFLERTMMPIVELTLMACAPNFSLDERIEGLRRSMTLYNGFGTTGVFEGHGVAAQVQDAYRALAHRNQQTVRATLVLSPAWGKAGDATPVELVRDWAKSLGRRGLGDDVLWVEGLYAEIDEDRSNWVRAPAAPQTGWAGFNYDCGLPRAALREVLVEAARCGLRASCIFSDVAKLYSEVDREAPIEGLRWVWGHIPTLTPDDVSRARDLGLVLVTHTTRHIQKSGQDYLRRLGPAREDEIVPLRRLIDAGVPVALGTDNAPPNLFNSLFHAVARRTGPGGATIAPGQKLTRAEALRCATWGGAYLCGLEDRIGTLAPGMRADLVVMADDFMTVPEDAIAGLRTVLTVVDGRIVFDSTEG
jgi:predicted amidohydrolase YtcJ